MRPGTDAGAPAALRTIPAVHRFLADPRIAPFELLLGKECVKRGISQTLDAVRERGVDRGIVAYDTLCDHVIERLEREVEQALIPVINATGIVLHTNLGRAPIATDALAAIGRAARGYSNLEYDLEHGSRGSRYSRASQPLKDLTGAPDALVVNNCAAAVLLILDTFAKGLEVVVSRNQLIEVGGGFRLPDLLERSGATLIEVGATNKVYLRDFERALSPRTALLLRSHPSNYCITGFTHDVRAGELVALGRKAGIPVVEDLGSGALVDLGAYGLPRERTVQEAIADGIDLVTFSADKLLGGPQAGIIAGSAPLIARLRSNPLIRALRVDKLTIAALIETLRLYANADTRARIPLFRMLGASLSDLDVRAARYCAAVPQASPARVNAYLGGGSLPEGTLPSLAITVLPHMGASNAAQRLRHASVPVIARVENEHVFFDLRTIAPDEDDQVIAAMQSILP